MQNLKKNAPVLGAAVPSTYQGMTLKDPNQKDQSDIALVRFSGGLPAGYEAAQLLPPSMSLKDGAPVTLAGFGITDGASGEGAGILRKVDVTLYSAKYGKTEVLMDQRNGKGACHGDSGGPAFITRGSQHYLFAVTDRGYEPVPNQDECTQFGVFARIGAHSAFLKKATTALRAIKSPR